MRRARPPPRLGLDLEVRTADAGSFDAIRDRMMGDVLMLCGIFGNLSDADVAHCVDASRGLVRCRRQR